MNKKHKNIEEFQSVLILGEKIKEWQKQYIESNTWLKYACDNKEENYPPRYYMNLGALELIDYIIEKCKL